MKAGIKLGLLLATTATAIASAAAPAAALAAAAQRAASHRLTSLSGYLYDGFGHGTTSANLSTGTSYTVTSATPNSRYILGGTTDCGTGYVTSGCPFTQGLNLNNTYQGDEIVQFYSKVSTSKCVGANTSQYSVVKDCPGGVNDWGSYWVWAAPNEFINVATTNLVGTYNVAKVMCTEQSTSGSLVGTEVWRSGGYCWRDLSG